MDPKSKLLSLYTFQIIEQKQRTNKRFVMVTDISNSDQQIGMYDKYYYNINIHVYSQHYSFFNQK